MRLIESQISDIAGRFRVRTFADANDHDVGIARRADRRTDVDFLVQTCARQIRNIVSAFGF